MQRWYWGLLGMVLGVSAADAGPIGTYYLTDFRNSSGLSTLDAIRGDQYQQNSSTYQFEEGPIAVVTTSDDSGQVRTTGFSTGKSGGDYAIVGDLSVASTGVTRTNNFASNVF
ncbi:MAG: hypothetical protein JSS02_00395, partial [Planctomycetes bacterium]|nr:hypothetical protein [Planctomycetota bacterium]